MAINAIIAALLKEFSEEQSISELPESEQFEHFVNYAVLTDIYSGEFNPLEISTGTQEFGLDGLAIIVNGVLVDDADEVDELRQKNKYLEVEFVFMQAKTSNHFDGGDLLKTLIAVQDFFGPAMKLLQGAKIASKHALKEHIYNNAAHFRRGPPKVSIYFAALGSWEGDANLMALVSDGIKKLQNTSLFSDVTFDPIELAKLRQLYFRTKNAFSSQINFEKSVALPAIPDVKEAYIGLLAATEYLKLICDEHGSIKKQLFFDNMRDFIADSEANGEIADTLASARKAEFPLRNNGVTIVARKLQRTGNKFDLEDYQIVNGCQTSHVLYNSRQDILGDIVVPIKIIVTEDDEVTSKIIRGSNVSNEFENSQLWATEPFHKDVEILFDKGFEGEARLFYERRRGQFGVDAKIEKVRIVTPKTLLKSFASMFLGRPHDVTKYYTLLEPEIGKSIFNPQHDIYVYYLAAFASFRLKSLFRNRKLPAEYKPTRHHLLMGFRYATIDANFDVSKRASEKALSHANSILLDQNKSADVFTALIKIIDKALSETKGGTLQQLAKSVTLRDKLRLEAPKLGFLPPSNK